MRWRAGTLFAAAGLPAAAAGALSANLPGTLLTAAFALLAALAAWRMLASRRDTGPGKASGPGKATAAGAGLGAVTGLLGVGGGFLAVPALVSVLAFPMAEAIGTSLLVISANWPSFPTIGAATRRTTSTPPWQLCEADTAIAGRLVRPHGRRAALLPHRWQAQAVLAMRNQL